MCSGFGIFRMERANILTVSSKHLFMITQLYFIIEGIRDHKLLILPLHIL